MGRRLLQEETCERIYVERGEASMAEASAATTIDDHGV